MRNSLIISLIIVGCFACEAPVDQSGESGNFALSQLIDDQINMLGSGTWQVDKEVLSFQYRIIQWFLLLVLIAGENTFKTGMFVIPLDVGFYISRA